MKIFLATHFQGTNNEFSLTWYNNLYLPLCEIAEEVVLFNFDLYGMCLHQDENIDGNKEFNLLNRPILEEELLKQIKESHKERSRINLFLSYFASSYCSGSVIKEISSLGIMTINWFCNASYQFYLVKGIAKYYDYCLVPEINRIQIYKDAGANPIYFQETANPKIYFPIIAPKKTSCTFIGGRYGNRYKYLKYIYNQGIDLKIYGANWIRKETLSIANPIRSLFKLSNLDKKTLQGFLPDSEINKVFNESKINLGFTTCGDGKTPQVRLRDFEIPMSGNFFLSEYNMELSNFFEEGKEIVFFQDEEDLASKSKFYLKNEFSRIKIAKNGYFKAVDNYSTQSQYKKLFQSLQIEK